MTKNSGQKHCETGEKDQGQTLGTRSHVEGEESKFKGIIQEVRVRMIFLCIKLCEHNLL